jgi:hypothetical protein
MEYDVLTTGIQCPQVHQFVKASWAVKEGQRADYVAKTCVFLLIKRWIRLL